MGGTKWNKGGTSEGTYGPVDWDHFAIQILPSVSQCLKGEKFQRSLFEGVL